MYVPWNLNAPTGQMQHDMTPPSKLDVPIKMYTIHLGKKYLNNRRVKTGVPTP
jgi:hypothetical protein